MRSSLRPASYAAVHAPLLGLDECGLRRVDHPLQGEGAVTGLWAAWLAACYKSHIKQLKYGGKQDNRARNDRCSASGLGPVSFANAQDNESKARDRPNSKREEKEDGLHHLDDGFLTPPAFRPLLGRDPRSPGKKPPQKQAVDDLWARTLQRGVQGV